ncbi:FxsA family membrane protein [Kitasatospora mediocidica]|uniref:FxsA family membrane protein n=1 Tax=Kitasatospora mediocidica TaxID=58352 RepID=UPI00068EB419|nr:FxsA family membrane protein [Kitasatospora mediocidica]
MTHEAFPAAHGGAPHGGAPAPGRPAGRRFRLRRVVPLVVTVWLVLEIWLLVQVASLIGWFLVLALLVGGAALGGSLVKRAGLKAFRAATASFEQGAVPPSGAAETGTSLTVLAGLLLILPGFLSDVLGLTLLFPPTRALWRLLGRRVAGSALRGSAPAAAAPLADALRLQEQLRIHRPDGKVIQGEVVDEPTDRP